MAPEAGLVTTPPLKSLLSFLKKLKNLQSI
jgi:hypothetical protein